jgi:hypothetical protein
MVKCPSVTHCGHYGSPFELHFLQSRLQAVCERDTHAPRPATGSTTREPLRQFVNNVENFARGNMVLQPLEDRAHGRLGLIGACASFAAIG